jgi:hypothetical protein
MRAMSVGYSRRIVQDCPKEVGNAEARRRRRVGGPAVSRLDRGRRAAVATGLPGAAPGSDCKPCATYWSGGAQ